MPRDSLLADTWRWCEHLLGDPVRPVLLGINGPQGCGKSTLAAALVDRARAEGHTAVTLSVDDFYLPHDAQRAIAARNPDEPLLAVRGGPGTHDVPLGTETLAALRQPTGTLALPRYDKSAWGGEGDRTPRDSWPRVGLPVDLVVVEGWLLGFRPLAPPVDARLARIDPYFSSYFPWTRSLSALLQLRTANSETIVQWRLAAETERRERNPTGALSREDARAYITRFLPFYAEYPEALQRNPPPIPHRVRWLDPNRCFIG